MGWVSGGRRGDGWLAEYVVLVGVFIGSEGKLTESLI